VDWLIVGKELYGNAQLNQNSDENEDRGVAFPNEIKMEGRLTNNLNWDH
jgi:hypothetical protein